MTNKTILQKLMAKGRQNYFDYIDLDSESQIFSHPAADRALIQIISQLTGQPKSSALKLDVLEFSEITK